MFSYYRVTYRRDEYFASDVSDNVTYMRDFRACGRDDADFATVEYLSHGDYAGAGLVGESNIRVFSEDHAASEGRLWWHAYGSHGYHCIVVRADIARAADIGERCEDEDAESVRETLCALADYPLLADDDHSELECERVQEDWQSYGRDDFHRWLYRTLTGRYGRGLRVSDAALSALFWESSDAWHYDPYVNDSGTSFYFDFDDWARMVPDWKRRLRDAVRAHPVAA